MEAAVEASLFEGKSDGLNLGFARVKNDWNALGRLKSKSYTALPLVWLICHKQPNKFYFLVMYT